MEILLAITAAIKASPAVRDILRWCSQLFRNMDRSARDKRIDDLIDGLSDQQRGGQADPKAGLPGGGKVGS